MTSTNLTFVGPSSPAAPHSQNEAAAVLTAVGALLWPLVIFAISFILLRAVLPALSTALKKSEQGSVTIGPSGVEIKWDGVDNAIEMAKAHKATHPQLRAPAAAVGAGATATAGPAAPLAGAAPPPPPPPPPSAPPARARQLPGLLRPAAGASPTPPAAVPLRSDGGGSGGGDDAPDGDEEEGGPSTKLLAARLPSRAPPPAQACLTSEEKRIVASMRYGMNQKLSGDLLWVDDNPSDNIWERKAIVFLGLRITCVRTTEAALRAVSAETYGSKFLAIVSTMSRPGDEQAGYTLLTQLRDKNIFTPFIIYPWPGKLKDGADAKATSSPVRLLELVLAAADSCWDNSYV